MAGALSLQGAHRAERESHSRILNSRKFPSLYFVAELMLGQIYPTDSSGAGMSGALRVAPSGLPNHHRWERLVLIEIAGRAASQATYRPEPPGSAGGTRNCRDCGSLHLELFEVDAGAYELWIDEVIQRWARFCSSVLAY